FSSDERTAHTPRRAYARTCRRKIERCCGSAWSQQRHCSEDHTWRKLDYAGASAADTRASLTRRTKGTNVTGRSRRQAGTKTSANRWGKRAQTATMPALTTFKTNTTT